MGNATRQFAVVAGKTRSTALNAVVKASSNAVRMTIIPTANVISAKSMVLLLDDLTNTAFALTSSTVTGLDSMSLFHGTKLVESSDCSAYFQTCGARTVSQSHLQLAKNEVTQPDNKWKGTIV